ncbi:ATP-dependent DNA helicase [Plasmodiophora brassicae]|uniref:ATP-dependent DNA helicase n=1 Tax=Plasmodiophora brassicae TaxID=37360 RepID=A0A0G4IQD1_PLABS|nr:hypothetical protein PBRA_000699 [Plasmodiophora brassicae]
MAAGWDEARVRSLLSSTFGVAALRPDQERALQAIAAGRDVFLSLPTGGGKSLCFQLPALLSDEVVVTVVVSPLLALMGNQVALLRSRGVSCAALNSTLSSKEAQQVRSALSTDNPPRLLYVTPESLFTPALGRVLDGLYRRGRLHLFAIDEAHCISSWGHSFRPSYRALRQIRERWQSVSILACTATATQAVQDDIVTLLSMRDPVIIRASYNRPNLMYSVRYKAMMSKPLKDDVLAFVKGRAGCGGIVYCSTRALVDELSVHLMMARVPAGGYHAGMAHSDRVRIQTQWESGDIDVIVGTTAFGMGIHRDDVRFVVHVDIPKSIEDYYQESGRAGRDGEPADVVLYYCKDDGRRMQYLISVEDRNVPVHSSPSVDTRDHRSARLDSIIQYCETASCRRANLLQYFGERSPGTRPQCCDYCRSPAIVTSSLERCLSESVSKSSRRDVLASLRLFRRADAVVPADDEITTMHLFRPRHSDPQQKCSTSWSRPSNQHYHVHPRRKGCLLI